MIKYVAFVLLLLGQRVSAMESQKEQQVILSYEKMFMCIEGLRALKKEEFAQKIQPLRITALDSNDPEIWNELKYLIKLYESAQKADLRSFEKYFKKAISPKTVKKTKRLSV